MDIFAIMRFLTRYVLFHSHFDKERHSRTNMDCRSLGEQAHEEANQGHCRLRMSVVNLLCCGLLILISPFSIEIRARYWNSPCSPVFKTDSSSFAWYHSHFQKESRLSSNWVWRINRQNLHNDQAEHQRRWCRHSQRWGYQHEPKQVCWWYVGFWYFLGYEPRNGQLEQYREWSWCPEELVQRHNSRVLQFQYVVSNLIAIGIVNTSIEQARDASSLLNISGIQALDDEFYPPSAIDMNLSSNQSKELNTMSLLDNQSVLPPLPEDNDIETVRRASSMLQRESMSTINNNTAENASINGKESLIQTDFFEG